MVDQGRHPGVMPRECIRALRIQPVTKIGKGLEIPALDVVLCITLAASSVFDQ